MENPGKLCTFSLLLTQWNSACSLPEAGARQMSHRFPQPTLAPSLLVSCRHTLPFFRLVERPPFLFPPPCVPAAVAAPLMSALSLVLLHPHPDSALQPRRVRVSAHWLRQEFPLAEASISRNDFQPRTPLFLEIFLENSEISRVNESADPSP